ncbi:hypothetical protein OS493_004325 [Desmophyllum pertusum]|uniref:Uncharacterized protein n=1 Tax=Desmophyllum pertusum TaxID=174260 RepID=A0A9W9ZSZ7_9CNID|nr:hypothetical protein OS493_004325 [Desmophyllum pertusum]
MEVDLSAPSSGFTSAEHTPDSSQTPLVLGSNESEGLETNQSIENSEKDISENLGQGEEKEERKNEKEEMESAEDNKPSLLSSDSVDNRETAEPCKKEEVLEENIYGSRKFSRSRNGLVRRKTAR